MKRVMCVYLPHWPLQRLLRERSALRGKAVVLFDPAGQRGPRVVLASAEAIRRGIRPGMPLAEATGIERNLVACELSPEKDRQALVALAHWAERYSPIVGLEEGPSPECLLLDITGCAACFRGEDRLLERARRDLEREGWLARVVIAETIGAAWALAHYALSPRSGRHNIAWGVSPRTAESTNGEPRRGDIDSASCRPSGAPAENGVASWGSRPRLHHAAAPRLKSDDALSLSHSPTLPLLHALPVASLRLPPDSLATLAQLGIERVEQLLTLPRDSLLARFGPRVLERLDQALGLLPEVVTPVRFTPPVQAAFPFDYPIDNLNVVNRVLDQLTQRLQQLLVERNRGARQVECWLYHEIASPWKVEIGLVQPSCSARRFSELLRIRLERVQIEEPITGLWLRVTAEESLLDRQASFHFWLSPRSGRNDIAWGVNPRTEAQIEDEPRRGDIEVVPCRPSGAHTENGVDSWGLRPRLYHAAAPRLESQEDCCDEQCAVEAFANLVEHLSSRLGPAAVTRAVLIPDPQPEHACRFEAVISHLSPGGAADRSPGWSAAESGENRGHKPRSPVGATDSVAPTGLESTFARTSQGSAALHPGLHFAAPPGLKKRTHRPRPALPPLRFSEGPGEGFRPLRLCPRPIPIEVMALVPEGPPARLRWSTHDHVVLRAWGPERIETGWWRGEDVHRDYYLVATRTGSRFWIFRRRDDGRWFLQGVFD